MDERRKLTILTVALAIVFIAQLAGLFDWINRAVNSAIPLVDTPLVRAFTFLGDDMPFFAFVFLAIFLDWRERERLSRETFAFVIAAFAGLAVVGLLKFTLGVPRPRPLPVAGAFSSGSFPSGHTFRAALIAAYGDDRWERLKPLFWVYALAITFTRLLLHYHWLSDVLFSLILAPWLYILTRVAESRWLPVYNTVVERLKLGVLRVE
ncbi:phosphatase PAP2 family protein [Thermococcus piezophilus]|uniref:Phosphatidic acid phosphatase type 2/haloperoxidase domain-containing protein n=1 Tax=Thermococcus piezophilus TaxID=1712654 RepID=A0A172WJJ8_9EURY|nr:phosphatase PAP2 family protein [Thermococcus piezophilus]ANF23496.1 hypothetical protein A7C91_10255 [Thermococcus piezophilus]